MNKKLFPWVVLITALGLSATSAYYSIIGLTALFAGVGLPIIIMSSFLELAKIIVAVSLHSYWTNLKNSLKVYLISALIILMCITSAGIYGLLSSGYSKTANSNELLESKIELVLEQKQELNFQKKELIAEKQLVETSINDLRKALGNNVITYKDKTGQLITSTSNANRKSYERQLELASKQSEKITDKVDLLNNKILVKEDTISSLKQSEKSADIGSLKYLSNITGKPMDSVINWFILMLIFVFDPLAITLIIVANNAFSHLTKPTIEPTIKPTVEPIDESSETSEEHSVEPIPPTNDSWYSNLQNISSWRKNKIKRENNDFGRSY